VVVREGIEGLLPLAELFEYVQEAPAEPPEGPMGSNGERDQKKTHSLTTAQGPKCAEVQIGATPKIPRNCGPKNRKETGYFYHGKI